MQEDATTRSIVYASQILQKHEHNYEISELEALTGSGVSGSSLPMNMSKVTGVLSMLIMVL